jgi:hypothetical protein
MFCSVLFCSLTWAGSMKICTRIMYWDMQYGHGHAAWKGTLSMYWGMQHGHGYMYSIDMDMQHGDKYGHAA